MRAEAAATLGKTTWERLERLSRDGVVPAQRRDEAEANWKAARAAADAARAVYDMALAGARGEDKDAAAAVVRQAQGAVSEVEAYLGETTLVAPRDGEVAARNVEPGELTAPGYPVVTLVDLSDAWVVFNLREDRLAGLKVGDRLDRARSRPRPRGRAAGDDARAARRLRDLALDQRLGRLRPQDVRGAGEAGRSRGRPAPRDERDRRLGPARRAERHGMKAVLRREMRRIATRPLEPLLLVVLPALALGVHLGDLLGGAAARAAGRGGRPGPLAPLAPARRG